MVLSYYILKCPYSVAWNIFRILGKLRKVVFYCADPLDCEMFEPIRRHLPPLEIVAKNEKTRKYLENKGEKYIKMPAFPEAVIMARHAAYKFPVKNIIKVGFDHGLYQFKRWTSPENYNAFNIYFVSSPEQVKTAQSLGISSTKAIGYPKLDPAFDGTYNATFLDKLRKSLNLDNKKPTVIFTSTWNVEGLSALDRWIDRVGELTEKYNILLTVHTWTEKHKIEKLKKIKGAIFLEKFDVTPYIMISDVFVGDYNSLIGEACALDKPIVTFRVPESKRAIKEVREMIAEISIQIDTFDEIYDAIERCLENPDEKKKEREKANEIMYLALDGKAGKRAADEILRLISF